MMRRALGLAGLIIFLDQASKVAMLDWVLVPPRTIEITGFFNLVLVFNPGISFGLFGSGSLLGPYLLSALAVAISAGLLIWLKKQPEKPLALAVGLIVGGALGNVIDRFRFGAVVDFLDFHLAGWHWPAFNLADSAITLGVVVILLDGLFRDSGAGKKAAPREVDE